MRSSNILASVFLSLVSIVIPLFLWRGLFPSTDWAIVAIAPLAIFLFFGTLNHYFILNRARLRVIVRKDSKYSNILTGRLRAILTSAIFTTVAIPVLAWQSLTASIWEIAGFCALILVASYISLRIQDILDAHLRQPYSGAMGLTLGAYLAALMFIPLLAWISWNFVEYRGEFRTADFSKAVTLGMQELPARRGWISEVLAPLYAIEAGKLWLVVQLGSSRWATILFSLDTTLVGFILARTAAIITNFAQVKEKGGRFDHPQ